MAQADSEHNAKPRQTPEQRDAGDTLSHRITQAIGVIAALTTGYDDKTLEFHCTPKVINTALWAAEELLEQALEAWKVVEGA